MERRSFFQGLASLAFVEKAGLWVPPDELAVGGVTDRKVGVGIEEAGDLILQIKLVRSDGSVVNQMATNVRSGPCGWYALTPDTGIYFKDGKVLYGYFVTTDVR